MNIAFVYSSLRKGGAERVISSLANYFVSNDQVNIITLDNYDSEYELAPGVKHLKLDVSGKSVSLMDKFRSIRTQIARIAETVAAMQPDVIVAFGQIADQIPDYQVHIYGVGDEQEMLEGLANELKIGDRVRFWGLCDRISDVLCRNRIFVLTSESEGMPNGLIEAMACGCACIASDCDFGPSELIREGENGVLFPVGDVDRLASALLEMATDRGKAERIARNAQKINDTLSIERIANQYHDYIEMIAQRGRE